jgi:hypothetical protein
MGCWRERGGDGEAGMFPVRGWFPERTNTVAARLFANKLALVMLAQKLF